MRLYTHQIAQRHAMCAGYREDIDQSQGYIQLELQDNDRSLRGFGWDHAEFHTERCIAMMLKAAYTDKEA